MFISSSATEKLAGSFSSRQLHCIQSLRENQEKLPGHDNAFVTFPSVGHFMSEGNKETRNFRGDMRSALISSGKLMFHSYSS
jgi:hypothetical protein